MTKNDDWRMKAELDSSAHADEIAGRLRSGEMEHRLETGRGDRVVVSVDGKELFLYAGSREQAQAAGEVVRELATAGGLAAKLELRHWHPIAEEWEDPDAPMPTGPDAVEHEQEELAAEERHDSEAAGYPEFEVRVTLHSHSDTLALAERLQSEGIPTLHRWHYLLVGAQDELDAHKLAERIQGEVPADSRVTVEGTAAAVRAEMPPNPFAVFGGLGG